MIKVCTIKNPYNPKEMDLREVFKTSATLAEIGSEFKGKPWLCLAYIDKKQYYPLQSEWEDILVNENDIVYFFPYIGGGSAAAAYLIISIIISVAVSYLLTPDPPDIKRNDLGEADPVFTLSGEKNQIRLNQPIEDPYGRVRLWPSVAALSYNQYLDNNQYLHQLLCLGQGSYDIENVYIEDTPIANFQETEYEIYGPNEQVTLFRDNVVTSSEVGRLELFGPNEPEYTGPVGPFVANEIGTKTDKLEWDLEFPQGLMNNVNVTADIQYREIDENGDPVGSWQTILFDQTLDTLTPQRFTIFTSVNPGRYESRVARTSDKNTNPNIFNLLQWTGLRAFLTSATNYGDVTILAIKARATNNLNDTSAQKFNCVGTRKLPIYNGVSIAPVDDIASRVATRNPVWAFVQIFRSQYGGNLEDKYLDLDNLLAEANYLDTEGITFDFIFDQKSTVWEAVKVPAFVAKATPILSGSKVTWIRDTGSQFPTFFINPENTLQNSFKLQKRLYDLNENDGLEVEYKDESTWKNETVLCTLGTQQGINPKKTTIRGVQNRQRAYELGCYQWAKETYERELISLTTGMEGYIPSFGDVVRIGSDIPKWGTSGYVLSMEETGGVTRLVLSENVDFTGGETRKIAIRGKYGQELGPYTCTLGSFENDVIINDVIPIDQVYFDKEHEPPYFIFGIEQNVGRICRITDIQPSNDSIEIRAIVDDLRRFDDPGEAPPIGS